MRSDVSKIFGKGEEGGGSLWFYFPKHSVAVTISDGTCTEGWLAPKNTVIETSIHFFDHKKLSDLKKKVNLDEFKLDRFFDTAGGLYFNDTLGVRYAVNHALDAEYKVDDEQSAWSSIIFYPSSKYSRYRCKG